MSDYESIVVTTPSSPNANSYLTASDATTYLTQYRLYEGVWQTASLQAQETALIWATQLLDRSFDYRGSVTNYYQALRWPRVGVIDDDGRYVDQNSIPPIVQQSTAVLAAELVKQDRTLIPALLQLGLKSARIGSLSIDLDQNAILSIIPDYVILWMGKYGEIRPGATNGARVVRLSRS